MRDEAYVRQGRLEPVGSTCFDCLFQFVEFYVRKPLLVGQQHGGTVPLAEVSATEKQTISFAIVTLLSRL
jgi:hypothetical protein